MWTTPSSGMYFLDAGNQLHIHYILSPICRILSLKRPGLAKFLPFFPSYAWDWVGSGGSCRKGSLVRRWGRLFPPRDKARRPLPVSDEWMQTKGFAFLSLRASQQWHRSRRRARVRRGSPDPRRLRDRRVSGPFCPASVAGQRCASGQWPDGIGPGSWRGHVNRPEHAPAPGMEGDRLTSDSRLESVSRSVRESP